MSWEDVVEELEQSTARLRSVGREDLLALAEVMNRRSAAVQRLQELTRSAPVGIPAGLLERIRKDYENGASLKEKLLLVRAAARAEITRIAETGYLMRALSNGKAKPTRRVNCTA